MKIMVLILFLFCGGMSSIIHASTTDSVLGKYDLNVLSFTSSLTPNKFATNITLDIDGVWERFCQQSMGSYDKDYICNSGTYKVEDGILTINFDKLKGVCDDLNSNYFCYVEGNQIALILNRMLTYPVTISKSGTGSGIIHSASGSIDCGDTCTSTEKLESIDTYIASANIGSVFTTWTGCDTVSETLCKYKIKVGQNTLKAMFTKQSFSVTITNGASTKGVLKSDDNSLNCGTDGWGLNQICTSNFDYDALVTLTAIPLSGKAFNGWPYGLCTGSTNTCIFNVKENKTISIYFY